MSDHKLQRVRLLNPRVIGHGQPISTTTDRNQRTTTFALGEAGSCPDLPSLTVIIADDSASITAQFGHDPLAQRYSEAKRAIDHIGRSCICRHEFVTIIHFDQPSPLDVPPQRLHRRGRLRLRSGLRSTGSRGSSDLAPALDKAEHLATQFRAFDIGIVVMTDFLLTDRDPPGVVGRLISFEGHVHAVALNADPPQILRDAPHVSISTITQNSEPGATARAIFESMTANRAMSTTHQDHDQ
ncbi:hypothetical protein F6X56_13610 [Rhodococcus erythropolis]|uniref:hypothetical protein n=1 Tax=Rhodococcus erythropolis TaxID=1833 RepID=UPI001245A6B3|nr:hypothetical protein [Rhodococcus erythropolis]QEX10676.1 hypothetical protein F6X56_13610 [Rhodococcus erythropolis]